MIGVRIPRLERSARLWLVCGAISIVLHAVLLLPAGVSGTTSTSAWRGSSDLQIALVDAPRMRVDERAVGALRVDPLPSIAPIRAYPRLLPFSPIALPPPRFDEAAYQPLNALTVLPTAAQEIVIAYPQDSDSRGLLVAALTLFIDEDGSVARVRVGEPRPPASYERAAVDAFSKARFNPGLSGQRPVKTRMVIRVAFETDGTADRQSSRGIRFR